MKIELKSKEETRILIAETGKSLNQFSKHIGISQPYLSQVLMGDKFPSATVAFKIAKGLKLEIRDIFFISVTDISIIGDINNASVKERTS